MKRLAAFALILTAVPFLFAEDAKKFTDRFTVDKDEWSSTGRNRFFILEPGYVLVLEGKDKKEQVKLTITVLNETLVVDGVETRVVEEREEVDGEPEEISRNYFAISKRTTAVYYFGEDVDVYEDGKIKSHPGVWRSGVNGAHFGLMMPGTELLGARYCQEIAPGVAMDRAEIVDVDAKYETPAGTFEHCLKTEESSELEKGTEPKVYAPGIGQIMDEALKLTFHGKKT